MYVGLVLARALSVISARPQSAAPIQPLLSMSLRPDASSGSGVSWAAQSPPYARLGGSAQVGMGPESFLPGWLAGSSWLRRESASRHLPSTLAQQTRGLASRQHTPIPEPPQLQVRDASRSQRGSGPALPLPLFSPRSRLLSGCRETRPRPRDSCCHRAPPRSRQALPASRRGRPGAARCRFRRAPLCASWTLTTCSWGLLVPRQRQQRQQRRRRRRRRRRQPLAERRRQTNRPSCSEFASLPLAGADACCPPLGRHTSLLRHFSSSHVILWGPAKRSPATTP